MQLAARAVAEIRAHHRQGIGLVCGKHNRLRRGFVGSLGSSPGAPCLVAARSGDAELFGKRQMFEELIAIHASASLSGPSGEQLFDSIEDRRGDL